MSNSRSNYLSTIPFHVKYMKEKWIAFNKNPEKCWEKIDFIFFCFWYEIVFSSSTQIEHTRFAQHQLSFWSNFQLTTKPKRQRKIRNDLFVSLCLYVCMSVSCVYIFLWMLLLLLMLSVWFLRSFTASKLRCSLHTTTLYMKSIIHKSKVTVCKTT